MKKRRWITKLTVETERTFIFRNRGPSRVGFCDPCGSEVELMCVAKAALASGRGELAIYKLLQAGSVHFVEDEGHVLVCFKSLCGIHQRLEEGENDEHQE